MSMRIIATALAAASLMACTTTGNVERNAAAGAAIGGVAGAVIGNNVGEGDAGQGAAIGAVLGGAAGAARGYGQDQRLAECRADSGQQLYRDAQTGEPFYYVPGTERTCWADGRPRG
jgi:uncharacterized membrane protein